jgi:hypothetical protein
VWFAQHQDARVLDAYRRHAGWFSGPWCPTGLLLAATQVDRKIDGVFALVQRYLVKTQLCLGLPDQFSVSGSDEIGALLPGGAGHLLRSQGDSPRLQDRLV